MSDPMQNPRYIYDLDYQLAASRRISDYYDVSPTFSETADSIFADGLAFFEDMSDTHGEVKAFKCFRKAAELGHVEAMFKLGEAYRDMMGTPKDEKLAFHWFNQALLGGRQPVVIEISKCYFEGKGVPLSVERGIAFLEGEASKGNIYAINWLGDVYAAGHFVDSDLDRARAWFRLALALGDEYARYKLTLMPREENGEPVDYYKTQADFAVTEPQTYNEAAQNLVEIVRLIAIKKENMPDAVPPPELAPPMPAVLLPTAPPPRVNIPPTPAPQVTAQKIETPPTAFTPAAPQQVALERPTATSLDVPLNELREQAEAGSLVATLELANCYHKGRGTRRDDIAAHNWYMRAAQTGSIPAMEWLAEEHEDRQMMMRLATIYLNGEGIAQDPEKASYWQNKAAQVIDYF